MGVIWLLLGVAAVLLVGVWLDARFNPHSSVHQSICSRPGCRHHQIVKEREREIRVAVRDGMERYEIEREVRRRRARRGDP